MKYLSYTLKQVGTEGHQPLALFKKWKFNSGIPFGNRYLVALDTNEDLAQLIVEGSQFNLREENEVAVLAQSVARMRQHATELRRQADDIDARIASGDITP